MYSRIYGLVTTKEGTRNIRSADISELVMQFPDTTDVTPLDTQVQLRPKPVPAVTVKQQLPSAISV
jgi:hypothetical protein